MVPGMGTIQGCWARIQARAICAGVAPLRSAITESRSTRAWLAVRACSVNRGRCAAEVAVGEGGRAVDGAGEEALAERAEGHEADAELEQGRQDLGFGFAPPQGVFALQRGDRLDGVGAADDVDAGFGQAEVGDLAGVDELLDGAGDVLDRHVGVDAVLVEQVDAVDVQPAQGVLDGGADVLGAAVQAGGAAAVEGEPELGGDHDLVADRSQRLADELLVGERPVDLGGVEEGDAEVDGGADERDAVLLVDVKP